MDDRADPSPIRRLRQLEAAYRLGKIERVDMGMNLALLIAVAPRVFWEEALDRLSQDSIVAIREHLDAIAEGVREPPYGALVRDFGSQDEIVAARNRLLPAYAELENLIQRQLRDESHPDSDDVDSI